MNTRTRGIGQIDQRDRRGRGMNVGLKISLLVAAIIALFLVVSALSFIALRESSTDMAEADQLTLAASNINAISASIKPQYDLIDALAAGDEGQLDEILANNAEARDLINQSRSAVVAVPGGIASLEKLRGISDALEYLVRNDINDAVATGEQQQLQALSTQLRDLLELREAESVVLAGLLQTRFSEWEKQHGSSIKTTMIVRVSATVVATIMALALGLMVSRRFRNRLRNLTDAVDEMTSGRLESRVEVRGSDELSELGKSFNVMAATIEAGTAQLQGEQSRIRSIHQSISDGIIVFGRDGDIQSMNPAAESAIGRLEKDMLGRRKTGIAEIDSIIALENLVLKESMVKCWHAKDCTHPECPSFESRDLRCWLQCGTFCHNEIQGTFQQKRDACERCDVYIKNGVRSIEFKVRDRIYSGVISPNLDDEGHEVGRLVVLHDITDIRATDAALRSRNRELMVINDIVVNLTESYENIDIVLNEALVKISRAVGGSAGLIMTYGHKDHVEIRASTGLSIHSEAFLGLLSSAMMKDLAIDTGKGLPDNESDMRRWRAVARLLQREGLQKPVIFPIDRAGATMGMLVVADKNKADYDEDDMRLLKASALHVGVALQNADLFRWVNKARRTWETTFDAMGDGVYVLDMEQKIVMANQAMADLLGVNVEELIGRKCYEVTHGSTSPKAMCPFKGAIGSVIGDSVEVEEKRLGKTFRININPVFDDDGASIGMIHVMSDITEKNKLRTQLMQSEKMAAVGQLVSGVAHELNNPLTGVMGYAKLLHRRMQGSDEEAARYLEIIIREAERSTGIIQNLLSFARKQQPEKTAVDINEAIRNILQLRGYVLRANDIEVNTILDDDLPDTLADFHQIEQVLLNIINNAEKAITDTGGPGKITVRTRHEKQFVIISVADDGKGIEPQVLSRIYDPFFTTREIGRGTGLGLSACYGIVEEHGGEMSVESEPGAGTTFIFTLPVIKPATADDVAAKESPEAKHGGVEPRRQVLLVDDEPAIVELLSDILTMEGHGVDVAQNCSAALRKLASTSYDNVITDVSASGIEGKELYQRIREIDPGLAANVIFITNDSVDDEDRKYVDRTGNFLLVKPFDLQKLRNTINKVMTNNE